MANQGLLDGSLTAADQFVGPIQCRSPGPNTRWQVIVTGTFTGSLEVRVCPPGVTAANGATDGEAETGRFVRVLEPAGDCDIYVLAATLSSGTATVSFRS